MISNHFTATGVVFNSERKILMILHNKLHVWLPPGGHIDENELPDDAVLREIFEETGIKASIISTRNDLFISNEHCRELELPFVILLEDIEGNGAHNHIDMVYLCKAINEELVPQETEINGIGWFTFEEILKLNTYDNVIKTVSKAVKYLHENYAV